MPYVEEMPEEATWRPACPSCDRTIPTPVAQASRRRDAVSSLEGTQATCSGCGETFTVDRQTLVRKA